MRLRTLALLALSTLSIPLALGQPEPAKTPEQAKPAEPPKVEQKPGQPKPYKEVVTAEAVTQEGVFKVHRIEDKVLFEIPGSALGREMLWQTEVSELPQGYGFIGSPAGTRVIRWTRRNNKVYLRNVSHSMRTEVDGATRLGLDASSIEPIIMVFNVEAENDKKDPVIDVTALYTTDPSEFSAKEAVGGSGVDPNRSYIDRVKAFPTNIETRSVMTFSAGGGFNPFNPFGGNAQNVTGITTTVHYSLVMLPDKPMMGRLADSRVGYFTIPFTLFGRPEHRAVEREYIARFRLEKKDPSAAVSEPVKPIVFYLAREVPEKWRPYLKKGVEDWNVAFEQAGFRNAIQCKDAPTKAEDPDWDPEDARYSVIRWAPSSIQNAMGPSIQDPRSGETISAHIIFWHNILQLVENWYFVQCAAVDPRARRIPMPDDLMGELVRYVAAHEVGHTLGLQHNMKASHAYTIAQLRDPKFTAEFGVSPSIMDYSRFNYVAQPGDNVTQLIGKIGPYDKFAIEYGYKVLPAVRTAEDEKGELDRLLARQVTDPRLRFGGRYYQDPTVQTEDIGDDAVEATRLGLRNNDRIAKLLMPATTKLGEDYTLLRNMHSELMFQRMIELFHVVELVGGVVETDYHAGRGGDVFRPVPKAKQAGAVKFLVEEGFQAPKALYAPELMNRMYPDGIINRMTMMSKTLLGFVLNSSRVRRMLDNEAANGARAYTVEQMVTDLTNGVWKETGDAAPKIDVYRRTLQRAFLSTMDQRINGIKEGDDLRPIAKSALRSLAKRIDAAVPKSTDKATSMHLAESRKEIELILAGKTKTEPNPFGEFFGMFFLDGDDKHQSCFSHAVRMPRALKE